MGNKKAGGHYFPYASTTVLLSESSIIKSDYFLMILTAAPLLMRTK